MRPPRTGTPEEAALDITAVTDGVDRHEGWTLNPARAATLFTAGG
jgi:hypothetical protein